MYTTLVAAAVAVIPLFTGCNAQIPTANCPSGTYSLVDPSQRPASRNCGGRGFLAAPSPLGNPVVAASEDACVQTCKATPGCISFGYSANNATSCVLYNKKLIDMKYRNRMADLGTVFSNQLCYKCKPIVCENTDAIRNGGFEVGSEADDAIPEFWTLAVDNPIRAVDFNRYGDEPHSGATALSVQFQDDEVHIANATQIVQCAMPGVEYQISAWFKGKNTASLAIFFEGNKVYGPTAGGFPYVQISVPVTPTSYTPTIVMQLSAARTVLPMLDDVSMVVNTPL